MSYGIDSGCFTGSMALSIIARPHHDTYFPNGGCTMLAICGGQLLGPSPNNDGETIVYNGLAPIRLQLAFESYTGTGNLPMLIFFSSPVYIQRPCPNQALLGLELATLALPHLPCPQLASAVCKLCHVLCLAKLLLEFSQPELGRWKHWPELEQRPQHWPNMEQRPQLLAVDHSPELEQLEQHQNEASAQECHN